MSWNSYQERLAPGEWRRFEAFRADLSDTGKAMTMWRSARFRGWGWKNTGSKCSEEPFDGLELIIDLKDIGTVGSMFDPEVDFHQYRSRRPEMRYAVRSKRLLLSDRTQATASGIAHAIELFGAFAAKEDPSLPVKAVQEAATKLVNMPVFSASTPNKGWGHGDWMPDSSGTAIFIAGMVAVTVPVLILARRVA